MLNHAGAGRFKAYSAGSSPRPGGSPHLLGLQVLREEDLDAADLRSKSWDEYAKANAPQMDLIITVCDNAAGEVCPYWPGNPAGAHWGYANPSAGDGSESQKKEAFHQTLYAMRRRMEMLVKFPVETMDRASLQRYAQDLSKA